MLDLGLLINLQLDQLDQVHKMDQVGKLDKVHKRSHRRKEKEIHQVHSSEDCHLRAD